MAVKKEPEQEINLTEVQDLVAKMLADAKAEAQKIVDEAKAASNGEMTAEEAEARKAQEAYMEELVEVKLFKDNGKYKDDVFVGCNGESIAIKRGERVKIKRKFAEVLDNSEHQDYETSKLIDAKSDEFAKSGL